MFYDEVAKVYEATYGEPLVAGPEWVEPLFDACKVAVECGGEVYADDDAAAHAEAVERTAAVIATITYGAKDATLAREQTAGHKWIEATS